MKKAIVIIAAIGLAVMYGCAGFQDALTPCFVEPAAVEDANVPPTIFLPYTSVWDSERVHRKLDHVFELRQLGLARLIEDAELRHLYLKNAEQYHLAAARELQVTLFSPAGSLGMLVPSLLGGTLGAILIPRPGDEKKKPPVT